MSKHTPGPWSYRDVTAEGTKVYAKIVSGKTGVGFAGAYKILPRAEADANARLIAAAPDLLAALQKIPARYLGDMDAHTPGASALIRAAIAKATAVSA